VTAMLSCLEKFQCWWRTWREPLNAGARSTRSPPHNCSFWN